MKAFYRQHKLNGLTTLASRPR